MEFPSLINFRLMGCWVVSIFQRNFCKQTAETLIRRRILWHLIWFSTVCLRPIKRTFGLYGLKGGLKFKQKLPLKSCGELNFSHESSILSSNTPSCYICNSDICCLMTTFANSLDPDQDPQNVGPDLDPNTLTLVSSDSVHRRIFPISCFGKKVSRQRQNLIKLYPTCKDLRMAKV